MQDFLFFQHKNQAYSHNQPNQKAGSHQIQQNESHVKRSTKTRSFINQKKPNLHQQKAHKHQPDPNRNPRNLPDQPTRTPNNQNSLQTLPKEMRQNGDHKNPNKENNSSPCCGVVGSTENVESRGKGRS